MCLIHLAAFIIVENKKLSSGCETINLCCLKSARCHHSIKPKSICIEKTNANIIGVSEEMRIRWAGHLE